MTRLIMLGVLLLAASSEVSAVSDQMPDQQGEGYAIPRSALALEVDGAQAGVAPLGAPLTVTWRVDQSWSVSPGHYDFVMFAVPNTVRLAGTGFLALPANSSLPFGFNWHQEEMRIVFPRYLADHPKQGSFVVRPLIAGEFRVTAAYLVVDRSGHVLASSEGVAEGAQSTVLEVEDRHPRLLTEDVVQSEEPSAVFLSPSGEYEVRVFKHTFRVFYANTGRLVLEKAGTAPRFSPTSRFLAYFPGSATDSVEILDILDQEVVARHRGLEELAWGDHDSLLLVNSSFMGYETFLQFPFFDGDGPLAAAAANEFGILLLYGGKKMRVMGALGVRVDLRTALLKVDATPYEGEGIFCDLLTRSVWGHRDQAISRRSRVFRGTSANLLLAYSDPYGDSIDRQPHQYSQGTALAVQPRLKVARLSTDKATTYRGTEAVLNRGKVLRFSQPTHLRPETLLDRLASLGISFSQDIDGTESEQGKTVYISSFSTPSLSESEDWTTWDDWVDIKSPVGFGAVKYEDILQDARRAFQDRSGEGGDEVLQDDGGRCVQIDLVPMKWRTSANDRIMLVKLICTSIDGEDGYTPLLLYTLIDGRYQHVDLNELAKGEEVERSNDYGSPVKAFVSADLHLLVRSHDGSSIVVFDLRGNKLAAFLPAVREPAGIEQIYLSTDARLVLQLNNTGGFYIYDLATKSRILNGVLVDDEAVLYTDDGFYEGTPEGARYIEWHYAGWKRHFDFSQFASVYRRPDLIEAILRGNQAKKPEVDVSPPPILEMTLVDREQRSGQSLVELSGVSQRPLRKLRLFVDGAPVREVAVSGKTSRRTLPLAIKGGKHWVTAVAYNDAGYSSTPQSVFVDASAVGVTSGRLYVVGIGVDHYPAMRGRDLRYAKRDVAIFAEAAGRDPAKLYAEVVVQTLFDEQVTPASVHQALAGVARRATSEDTLFVYFAGHGIRGDDGRFYLLTPEASLGGAARAGVAWETVAQLLAQVKAKVVVFLDSCHSGTASQDSFVANDQYVAELMKSGKAGMAVLAAAKGRQFSFEDAALGGGHGVFSYALAQALTQDRDSTDLNGNGLIELSELYRAVKLRVSKSTQGRQTPWLSRSEIVGEIPLL